MVMRVLPESKIWWHDVTDITEKDVIEILTLYNDMVMLYNGDYRTKISKSLKQTKLYGDCITLYRLLFKYKIKPRFYMNAHFDLYKKSKQKDKRFRRKFPTLASMATPAAIDKYKNYLVETGQVLPEAVSLSEEELIKYNREQLKEMMSKWHMSEKDLFADPVLAAQFSLNFLEKQQAFKELINEHYYEQTFNVNNYKELFAC